MSEPYRYQRRDMRITIINPNSTQAMNQGILESAKRVASRDDELRMLCVKKSPALINSAVDEVNAAYWTLKKAIELSSATDGYVIACHSDPAVKAIQEATGKVAVGIGFASLFAAAKFPGPSAILAISAKSIPRKEALAKRYGFEGQFDTFATGYTEEMTEDEVFECLSKVIGIAQKKKKYASFVLGCAGMGCVAPRLRKDLGLKIIDGTEEAVLLLKA